MFRCLGNMRGGGYYRAMLGMRLGVGLQVLLRRWLIFLLVETIIPVATGWWLLVLHVRLLVV